ncbi:MAG: hypothetical protein KGH75_02370 [Rhodospirillales bacterium]|nr:hypothetical protein [Rhodospirillales bacterium]
MKFDLTQPEADLMIEAIGNLPLHRANALFRKIEAQYVEQQQRAQGDMVEALALLDEKRKPVEEVTPKGKKRSAE